MGMTTVVWDEDTDDWNMPGDGGGNLPVSTVDSYFENWISARKNGTDNKTGHIVLQHELNDATVTMAEKWLPQIQEVFNVVPWNECVNIAQPYWESNFVYPVANGSAPVAATSSSAIVASTVPTSAAPQPSVSSASAGTNLGVTPASAGSRLSVSGAISVFLGMIAIGSSYAA
jgi:hypothetical protein